MKCPQCGEERHTAATVCAGCGSESRIYWGTPGSAGDDTVDVAIPKPVDACSGVRVPGYDEDTEPWGILSKNDSRGLGGPVELNESELRQSRGADILPGWRVAPFWQKLGLLAFIASELVVLVTVVRMAEGTTSIVVLLFLIVFAAWFVAHRFFGTVTVVRKTRDYVARVPQSSTDQQVRAYSRACAGKLFVMHPRPSHECESAEWERQFAACQVAARAAVDYEKVLYASFARDYSSATQATIDGWRRSMNTNNFAEWIVDDFRSDVRRALQRMSDPAVRAAIIDPLLKGDYASNWKNRLARPRDPMVQRALASRSPDKGTGSGPSSASSADGIRTAVVSESPETTYVISVIKHR